MPSSKEFFVSASLTLIIISGSFFVIGKETSATAGEVKNHVFISEVMFAGRAVGGGTDANDEFVELYNASDGDIDLKGCALRRMAETGKEYGLLSDLDAVIPAQGFLLIVPRDNDCADGKCYQGDIVPDRNYSTKSFLSENNGIALYDIKDEMIDSVGWGNVASGYGRIFAGSFSAGESIERRVTAIALEDDEFFLQSAPSPHNSDSTNMTGDSGGVAGEDAEEMPSTDTVETNEESGGAQRGTASQEKKIIVSELLINPDGDDNEMEFIELYNAGRNAVDMEGWSLLDLSGKAGAYEIPAGTRIGSGEYETFYSSETGLSLNNSGDGALLKDDAGTVIFETGISGAAEAGVAFALDEDRAWVWTTAATPGNANVIKAPAVKADKKEVAEESSVEEKVDVAAAESVSGKTTAVASEYDFSDSVFINEIFPDPTGRDNREGNYEWVEFYNDNDRAVDLAGWYLDDATDRGSKPFRFLESRVISAKGYLVVSSEESKLAFNNTEEEVNLLWPDEMAEDSRSYEKAGEDESYSLSSEGVWFWTPGKTPGAKNAEAYASAVSGSRGAASYRNSDDFTETEDGEEGEVLGAESADRSGYAYVSIGAAKRSPAGTLVGLVGIVSAPPSVFGENVAYLADKDSGEGIQLFSRGEYLPELALGDEVQAFGSVSEAGGEKRLALDGEIEKIGSNNLLKIASVRGADMVPDTLGSLVKIEGGVAERVDSRLFFLGDDAGDRIKIYAKPETGILFDNIKNGDRVSVTGIVSRTSGGYRLLPRFSTDVRFLERNIGVIMATDDVVEEESDRSIPFAGTQFFLFLVLLLFLDWFRMRIRSRKETAVWAKNNH